MSVLTIRMPDAKHQRLKHLAIEELSTMARAQHDTEMRFRVLAARGSAERGLRLLDKLDRAFARNSRR